METHDMPKLFILFYVVFLTFPLYIQWDQYIVVHVALSKQYHHVRSNFNWFPKGYI